MWSRTGRRPGGALISTGFGETGRGHGPAQWCFGTCQAHGDVDQHARPRPRPDPTTEVDMTADTCDLILALAVVPPIGSGAPVDVTMSVAAARAGALPALDAAAREHVGPVARAFRDRCDRPVALRPGALLAASGPGERSDLPPDVRMVLLGAEVVAGLADAAALGATIERWAPHGPVVVEVISPAEARLAVASRSRRADREGLRERRTGRRRRDLRAAAAPRRPRRARVGAGRHRPAHRGRRHRRRRSRRRARQPARARPRGSAPRTDARGHRGDGRQRDPRRRRPSRLHAPGPRRGRRTRRTTPRRRRRRARA